MTTLLPGESDTNPAGSLIDESVIVNAVLPALHTVLLADLVMWSECELIQWLDAGLKRLARSAGLFIGIANTNTVANSPTLYPLASGHVSTIHVSFDGSPLRPSSTAELEARDPAYLTTPGPPERWFQDTLGLAILGLHPVPDQVRPLDVIYHGFPVAVDCAKSHTTIPIPNVLTPALELYIIREAHSKEGDGYAPDIAAAAGDMAALYETAALEYWGAAG